MPQPKRMESGVPNIEPVDADAIEDPELKALVADAEAAQVPGGLFVRTLAHAPGYAKAFTRALDMAHKQGSVDHKLKEIIRVQLARTAEDPYFANLRSAQATDAGLTEEIVDAGSGDYDDDSRFSEAEKIALRYADQMFLDSTKIDAAFYDEMKKHFTEAQIMELGSFIALHYGAQVFMRTLQAFPEHDREGEPLTQEESARLYGETAGR